MTNQELENLNSILTRDFNQMLQSNAVLQRERDEALAKIARMQEWVHTMKHYGCNHDTKSASKDCRETADFFWEGDRVRGFFDELDVALNGSKGA